LVLVLVLEKVCDVAVGLGVDVGVAVGVAVGAGNYRVGSTKSLSFPNGLVPLTMPLEDLDCTNALFRSPTIRIQSVFFLRLVSHRIDNDRLLRVCNTEDV
jgi:hypothetical protein